MTRLVSAVMAASVVFLLQGCATYCRGDSCTRPESSSKTLVVWWPPEMRIESGFNAERPDHQAVSLER